MTKNLRRVLFLTFLAVFLLTTPIICLYSQGYRINLRPSGGGKIITQTGGIYLKILPKQAEVYLDGKLKEKTDFIFGSLLIGDLLPKKYEFEVRKLDFSSWKKNLEVKEKEVTEVKNIILFPQNPDFKIMARNVDDFWVSLDQRKIIFKEIDPPTDKGWSLKLYDLANDVKSQLIDDSDISPKGADLMSLEFSDDSKKVSLQISTAETIQYFTILLDRTPPLLQKSNPPQPFQEGVIASKKINNDIYYLDNFGHLYKNQERLSEEPLPVRQETEYNLEIFSNFIFLREGQTLYQFDYNSKSFEKFFDDLKDLKISPDSRKLVYFSDYEIWVLFLNDIFYQPQRKAGEKIFLMRLSENINNVFWLNSDYLVFNTANKIKISEIDNRDRINIADVGEFKNPDFYWDKNDKKLYILSEGNLESTAPLLP